MTPGPPSRTLLPLVGSAATFGLLAFPLAAFVATAFGYAPQVFFWPGLIVGAVTFWVACLSVSAVVAAVFVLTPNAITYEGLLAVPIILASGVFGFPQGLPYALTAVGYVLPTTSAVRILLGEPTGLEFAWLVAITLISSAVWFAVSRVAMSHALNRARIAGNLEVI